ncbi:Hypothetical protein PHPALM_14553 [Phytophthora palmivora]|uniref:Uncharacterized protein n=1 Tax=Phytophthora palmivora TaxID=4796 RepID=A0A2P4XUI5_9STRA|nr:Hypothetical protein PHPALM_14553 [Phytophthora palmivora]
MRPEIRVIVAELKFTKVAHKEFGAICYNRIASSLLLNHLLFHVGTVRTDRLGFYSRIIYKKNEGKGLVNLTA